jgi:Fur family transcriptional regulator, peroxide stress response regulator
MKHHTLLQQHNLKATPQRLAIINLMEHHGHISIDDLYHSIRQIFSSISLATLYKNIHSMMGLNLIREVKAPGLKTHYEIEKKVHAHVLCTKCGELKDLEFNPQSFMQLVSTQSAYQPQEVSVVISGICPKCLKN